MTEYDYIVAGAGGQAQPGRRRPVLLLEARTAERTRAMTVPSAWPQTLNSATDWASVTTEQADVGSIRYPRGRALGGPGAINAMAHVRAHRTVCDQWAGNGATGRGFSDLLPDFQRTEQAAGRDPILHGTSGPVPRGTGARRPPSPSSRGVRHRSDRRRMSGRAYQAAGRLADAMTVARDTPARCERALPPGDPLTHLLRTMAAGGTAVNAGLAR